MDNNYWQNIQKLSQKCAFWTTLSPLYLNQTLNPKRNFAFKIIITFYGIQK